MTLTETEAKRKSLRAERDIISKRITPIEEFTYDNVGNTLSDTVNDGKTDIVTQYIYGKGGQLLKKCNGLAEYNNFNTDDIAMTSYTYDGQGRLSKATDPLNKSESYSYDRAGNTVQVTQKDGSVVYNQYGPFGIERSYFAGSPEAKEYTYNNLGQVTQTRSINADSSVVKENYTYDAFGRVVSKTSNDGTVQNYTYDNNSNVTDYSLVKDDVVKNSAQYAYNNLNQLTKLTNNDIITSYSYDAKGRLVGKSTGDDLGYTYTYNNADLLIRMGAVGGDDIVFYNCMYSVDGLMKEMRATSFDGPNETRVFEYDNIGRLVEEELSKDSELPNTTYNAYTYDKRGNRTSKESTSLDGTVEKTDYFYHDTDAPMYTKTTVTKDSAALKEYETAYYTDANGNVTAKQTTEYTTTADGAANAAALSGHSENVGMELYGYDKFNRLIRYNSGAKSAAYTYGVDNLRAGKTVNGERTEFAWDGQNLAAEYKNGTANTYTYDPTGVVTANKNGAVSMYVKDYHGNVIGSIKDGLYETFMEYDAFGNVVAGAPDPFGYCGEYYDSESGLVYLRNRYYDSADGRFITEDPAKDGVNWYVYGANNPVSYVDPTGMKINGYRTSLELEYINNQLMKILSNKTAYKKAQATGGSQTYKNNLSSWASNERNALLSYMNDEFAGEGFAQLCEETLSNGASMTIEETSSLLCVAAYYRQQLDKPEEKERDLSYDKLLSVYRSACAKNVMYYMKSGTEVNADDVLDNYFYPYKADMGVAGSYSAYDPRNGIRLRALDIYSIDDQDDYQYAPDSNQ